VWEPAAGYVVTAVALAALQDRAQHAGADLIAGRRACGPLKDDGVVSLAGATAGELRAAHVVVAAGCASIGLLSAWWPPGRQARTRRIRCAIFASAGHALPAFVDDGTGVWGRPDAADGYLAGWPVNEWDMPVSAGTGLTVAEVAQVRAGVVGRLPFLAKADYLTGRFGTDLFLAGGPVLGRMPGALRTFAAVGWSGDGFKTAPAAAERILEATSHASPRN
jgi:glycine/D-amino acid oxidase-like deaminating enzyme